VRLASARRADPAFAQIFFVDPFLKDQVELRAICTVVDARHIEHHLAKEVAKGCVNEAVEQIMAADVVLLNKVDLVDAPARTALTKRLNGLNPLAPVHECEYAAVDVAELLDAQAFALSKHPAFAEGVRHLEDTGLQKEHPDHDSAVGSLVLAGQGDLEVATLKAWLKEVGDECGDSLWRVKGVVAVAGEPNKHVLQGVHKLLEVRPREDSTWVEGAPPAEGGRRCQIVLIGKDLSARRAALEASATEAFGFPLRVFNEDLQGPDPHAMPDIRPMLVSHRYCTVLPPPPLLLLPLLLPTSETHASIPLYWPARFRETRAVLSCLVLSYLVQPCRLSALQRAF